MREESFGNNLGRLCLADAISMYGNWPQPTCIVSDGPYGLGKFRGEPKSTDELAEWYAPHVEAWARLSTPQTVLWFWCSELGWAELHHLLRDNGWVYEECCIWDKGLSHVAGNCNSVTIRGVPVVTEVFVRYSRPPAYSSPQGELVPLKEWLLSEWNRSGLPKTLANEACGLKNAATRKYLTEDHLWYLPPPEMVLKMAKFCEARGRPTETPYFSMDGVSPPSIEQLVKIGSNARDQVQEWRWRVRYKWNHSHASTNVFRVDPVRGHDRTTHPNQKPLSLLEFQVRSCTDEGDVVWDPFAGSGSVGLASVSLGRKYFGTEVDPLYFEMAIQRLSGKYAMTDSEGSIFARLRKNRGL